MLFLGAYTPLTMDGDIIVDRVLASCYAFGNHDLAHIGVALLRWFPRMIALIFDEDYGISIYATTAEDISKWIMPPGNLM